METQLEIQKKENPAEQITKYPVVLVPGGCFDCN
jgi:hypothetical protein